MHLITKSLEDLLSELAVIKREATGRLSNVKNRLAINNDQERIRQTKVNRFVLKRVAELESESLNMREEFSKLFDLNVSSKKKQLVDSKQEDADFEQQDTPGSTTAPSNQQTSSGIMTTFQTTAKPTTDEEAAKLGFDMEALKKLGEEIGKRLDQFGKDAAKNIGDLFDGIKLVFREPPKITPKIKE